MIKKFEQIQSLFELNTNSDDAFSMSAYMRHKFVFYGIKTPKRKELIKTIIKKEKNKKIDWEFLDMCYQDNHRELQYVACDYLTAMSFLLTYDDIFKIEKYVRQKQWWDTIDFLDRIIGDIGLKDKRVDQLMIKWSKDDDFWVRRIAIDHQLSRKEQTDTNLLETIIANNFGSDEFFINKAIGWSLREYSKTNPNWVRKFINKYQSKMSKLSIKEATKYI